MNKNGLALSGVDCHCQAIAELKEGGTTVLHQLDATKLSAQWK
jgi:hypothetical protein